MSMLRSPSPKEQAIAGYTVCTGNDYSHITLIGTSCVNAYAMRGFLETRPQKATVQFLSEMKKFELFVNYFSRSALRIAANLVLSSWAYLLYVHSCLLDFLLAEFLELTF